MKQHVRAFAVGLLTSGVLLLAIYIFGNNSSDSLEDMEPDELISALENQGYAVLTQDEYIAYSVNREAADGDDSDGNAEEDAEADNEADESDSNNDSDENEDNNDENSNEEDSNENEDGEDSTDEGNEDEESSEDSDVVEVEITLENGAPPSNISDALEDAGIIDDAKDFNDFLEDNDLSGSVKPGTYEVDSEMSFDEIGDIITTYSE
ncbi:endolytic transglycosylase MltG [Oceanobacillus sojae]|uniref:endolytic transglycosylase MltG n=1 Tax=Oceanobacillus sojae TaxID=582851 RepID=UPI0021A62CB7|nr:endolytic transglycosylase MltG [Oceanobacillus sojae]MCT1903907.1 endolytic transglycosylase MltG [Oceanobacillus sojae]